MSLKNNTPNLKPQEQNTEEETYSSGSFGLILVLSAITTILISFIVNFLISKVSTYYLIVFFSFLISALLFKFLIDIYSHKNVENFFWYYDMLEQFKNDHSAVNDYVMGFVTLILTLIIVFDPFLILIGVDLADYKFLISFGILLSLIFFGMSILSTKAVTVQPLHPLPFVPTEEETVERTYNWRYNSDISVYSDSDPYTITAHINLNTLKCARNKPRIKLFKKEDIYKWSVYPEAITKEVKEVASKLRNISTKKNFYGIEEVTNTLSLIQQAIPYSYDKDTAPHHEEEYPRYPVETLYDKTGDCECKTFLACSLLLTLGYDVAYFSLPGHVALGIASKIRVSGGYFVPYRGEKYYYYETTAEGWRFGQIPHNERGKIEIVVPVHLKEVNDLSHCEGKLPTTQQVGNKISKDANIDKKEESK